ncbi:putative Alpha/Beta hydrolase protein [Seiridium cardinale]|uniref:Alpha/Beta hydrolase protein n=1 Tax=Seiridium cardinale TaxID=138064 RepID=A0ABR2XF09_9PEZI
MSLITATPGKHLWAIGASLCTLVKLPFLALYYLPRSNRPHPEWTILQCIMNNLMNAFIYHTAVVEAVTPLDLKAGALGDRFINIPPVADALSTDILTSDPNIKPQPTGGIWFPTAFKGGLPKTGKPIILHFHPGGYVMGDVRMDGAFAARLLVEKIGSYAFWNLYRLASNPNGRFPAALQDALAAYSYLLEELSIPASQIILSGDSAGAHIVICMLRYLSEHGKAVGLPAPRGALLFSPAINFLAATEPENATKNRNFNNDYMDPTFMAWGARRFVTADPKAAPYMNPLVSAFESPCPIWVYCGGCEIFYDDATEFVSKMKEIVGNDVTYEVERLANHDIFFAGNLLGWKKEAERIANEAGGWVARLA